MSQHADTTRLIELGQAVIDNEAAAIHRLRARIGEAFARACHHMLDCEGRVVVTGMGKSGHIGAKIAATLASTGTPAFFVHPGEASHGDLGMVTRKDVVLALSNSGETEELLTILPMIKRLGAPLIAMTGNPNSRLAREADENLDVSVEKEACPLGLAPTSSTTATLAMGDALAVALLEARGFTAEDFALSHPAGSLGRRLLLRIDDLMHKDDRLPTVTPETPVTETLAEMSRKGMGMTCIIDEAGRLQGIFTDGDLRRLLDHGEINFTGMAVREVMVGNCFSVHPGLLAAEALRIMETRSINALPVVDNDNILVGALNMHDLLRAGVV